MTLGSTTVNGLEEIRFPLCYEDAKCVSAFYAVESDCVRRHLPSSQLRPVEIGGKAVVVVAWFDYGRSSIGSYRELSIGILVTQGTRPSPQPRFAGLWSRLGQLASAGSYVLALPVTSALARDAGRLFAGLPKSVMGLPLTWSEGSLDATVLDGSHRVLTMRIPLGRGLRVPVPNLVVYSRLDDQLVATTVTTRFVPQLALLGRPNLMLEDREHPLSEMLRGFGLEEAPCLAITHGRITLAKLHRPVKLAQ